MIKFLTLLLLFVLSNGIFSQSFESQIRDVLEEKPRVEFKFDSRNSFISGSNVRVFGIKAGLSHRNKLSYGLGYNFLRSDLSVANYSTELGTTSAKLYYRYWSPYVDYVFYEDRYWQLSIPIQLGVGSTFYRTKVTGKTKLGQEFVMSYEPAITFQYRILKYFAVGAGIGYRLMIIDNKNVEERFNSPVYLLRFKFLFQDLYKDILN